MYLRTLLLKLSIGILPLAGPALAQDALMPHEVTEQASFSGGTVNFGQFVAANLQIPFQSAYKGINGRVYLKGIVETDGSISKVEVSKSLDPLCDEEAVRVMKMYRAWKPATLNGTKVRQTVHYPILFRQDARTDYDTSMQAFTAYFDESFRPLPTPEKAGFRKVVPVDERGFVNKNVVYEERKGNRWKAVLTIPVEKKSIYFKSSYIRAVSDSVRAYRVAAWDREIGSHAPEAVFQENGQLLAYTEFGADGKMSMKKEYDLNGMVREMHLYADSIDTELKWFGNGQVSSMIERKNQSATELFEPVYVQAWDADGTQRIKDGEGYWQTPDFNYNAKWMIEQGRVKAGRKEGVWRAAWSDSTRLYEEHYSAGTLQKGISYYGTEVVEYTSRGKQPAFHGGIKEFYRFLGENIRYPYEASRRGVSGRVFLSFTVCEDGSTCDYQVLNKVGFGIEDEALRVIKLSSGKWQPGELRGKAVRVKYNVPINFEIR